MLQESFAVFKTNQWRSHRQECLLSPLCFPDDKQNEQFTVTEMTSAEPLLMNMTGNARVKQHSDAFA
jgi:hypothetical protein